MIQMATNAITPRMAPKMSWIIGLPFPLILPGIHEQESIRFLPLCWCQNTIGNLGI